MAYLGYPPAQLAYDAEPYLEDTGAAESVIAERWDEVLADPDTGAILRAAAEIPALRRLYPYRFFHDRHPWSLRYGGRNRVGLSPCTEPLFAGSLWTEAHYDSEGTVARWSQAVARNGPVWLGDFGARQERAILAGALFLPTSTEEWLGGLRAWGPAIVGRAWTTLAEQALPEWTWEDRGPQRACEAARQWLRDPSEGSLIAVRDGAGRAKLTSILSDDRERSRAASAARLAANACLSIMGEPLLIPTRVDLFPSLQEARGIVGAELIPWALG